MADGLVQHRGHLGGPHEPDPHDRGQDEGRRGETPDQAPAGPTGLGPAGPRLIQEGDGLLRGAFIELEREDREIPGLAIGGALALDAADRVDDGLCRRRTIGRGLGQEPHHQVVAGLGCGGVHRPGGGGRLGGQGREHGVDRPALEGEPAGEEPVEDGAEAEQVGGSAGGLAAGLLGRHVGRRPHDRAGAGDLDLLLDRPGVAEVEDLGPSVRDFEPDVPRLDVAMDQPRPVRRGEAGGHLAADPERQVDRRRLAALEPALERDPLEELHGEERDLALLADLIDRDDVVVLDRRGGPCLAEESVLGLRGVGQLGADHLQRHGAEQVGVDRLEDEPHPPLADRADDPVMGHPAELAVGPGRVEEAEVADRAREGVARGQGVVGVEGGRRLRVRGARGGAPLGRLGVLHRASRAGREVPADPPSVGLGELAGAEAPELDRIGARLGWGHGSGLRTAGPRASRDSRARPDTACTRRRRRPRPPHSWRRTAPTSRRRGGAGCPSRSGPWASE